MVCVGRKMNESNAIELWIVGIEYVVIMVVTQDETRINRLFSQF
jgi:hypothetical protein